MFGMNCFLKGLRQILKKKMQTDKNGCEYIFKN